MKNKVYYCIPTYRVFDECQKAIESVLAGSLVPDHIIVCDNSGDGSGALYLQPLVEKHKNVHIWPQTYNLGCARAWNLFHKTIDEDYIIIANDDLTLGYDAIRLLVESAESHPDDVIFTGEGLAGNAYSLFLLKKEGFEKIGPFDERFYPAYLEDVDQDRRRQLLGYKFILVPGITFSHVGSATIKTYDAARMQEHHNSHAANFQYYEAKWGGLPGQEKYTEPFGGIF